MRFVNNIKTEPDQIDTEDPLNGIAQLFDISIAFIVAVIGALFTLMSSYQIFSKDSEWTLTQKGKNGEMVIIEKKNNEIIKRKVSPTKMSGNGIRLGSAYRLENGQVIYVEEPKKK